MRSKLRQEWPGLPPEARPQQRRELKDRLEERRDPRQRRDDGRRDEDRREPEGGYGQGYGSRFWGGPDANDERRGGRR